MEVTFRQPETCDASPIWELVRASKSLDLNSPYAYLLVSTHFAATSVVAEIDRQLVGFVAAYTPPPRLDAVFVWQVGVAEAARGKGLGRRLLERVVSQSARSGVRFLEATVTPSNRPSLALFRGFARQRGVSCEEELLFPREVFPRGLAHEPEMLLRIGPLGGSRPAREEKDSGDL